MNTERIGRLQPGVGQQTSGQQPQFPGRGKADQFDRSGGAFTAFGLKAEAEPIRPGLHIVATPIGNLKDISFRALATLAAADTVIAEDTRITKKLLAHYGIATPLVAYHEHNAAVMRPHLLARLEGGAALALVSDAGTPLISDPGFKLAAEALTRNIAVVPVPGASAVLAALMAAGLPTDRFFFEGFLPPKSAARRGRIAELASVPGTLVFFESPRRLAESLRDLAAVLGPREAAIARELTKCFESVRRAPLPELAAAVGTEATPRGEIVLLVGPPAAPQPATSQGALDEKITRALADHSVKDAAAMVSAETGEPRRKVYARAIELSVAVTANSDRNCLERAASVTSAPQAKLGANGASRRSGRCARPSFGRGYA